MKTNTLTIQLKNNLKVIVLTFALAATLIVPSIFTASAHDSHNHKAPWQACADKQLSAPCAYNNGRGDLFKGACQAFSEVLMCVRNQPIIDAEELKKAAHKTPNNEITSAANAVTAQK